MKKKVAIITFHASHNCGSMLQAYALQRVIRNEIGLDNELINYSNQGQKEMYAFFVKVRTLRNILGNLLKFCFYFVLDKQRKSYESFINEHLIVASETFSHTEELKEIDGKYEYYICGSDQVWNNKAVDSDDAYFLSFVTKGKKIAYATSLGATNIIETESAKIHYSQLLSDFSAISVREFNAKPIIQSIFPHDVPVLLDPTILLSKEEWGELISERLYKEKYIFYYAFNYKYEVNLVVNEIAKKYNMSVIIVDAKAWGPGRKFMHGFKLSKELGPLAFLNLIKYASLVLTTSFHGTAFSVKMEKKFWFIKSSMHNVNDGRAESLLTQLSLKERLVSRNDMIKLDIFEPINYGEVNLAAKKHVHASIAFLKSTLSL